MDSSDKRIGIFGGTFDPIHFGHMQLASTAYDVGALDRILFMPAREPYHRDDKQVSSYEDRVNMINLAIDGDFRYECSDFEANLPGPSYTANTLEKFKEAYPDKELFLIIGGDSLFSIESWHEPEKIFELATILTSKRIDESKGASGSCAPTTYPNGMPLPLDKEFAKQVKYLEDKYNARIKDINMLLVNISSSGVIEDIKAGKHINFELPESIYWYIKDHHLYE